MGPLYSCRFTSAVAPPASSCSQGACFVPAESPALLMLPLSHARYLHGCLLLLRVLPLRIPLLLVLPVPGHSGAGRIQRVAQREGGAVLPAQLLRSKLPTLAPP